MALQTQQDDVVITKEGFIRRLLITGMQNISYGEWEKASLPAIVRETQTHTDTDEWFGVRSRAA